MIQTFTSENIQFLDYGQIFVFGSNLAGRHGKGAALTAAKRFGAIRGQGEGLMWKCYAIPTKDENLKIRGLGEIERSVNTFLRFALAHGEHQFLVTKIGCGEAGYTPNDIAPLFRNRLSNVILPKEFHNVLVGELSFTYT